MKKLIAIATTVVLAFGMTGCNDDDADVASENLSKAADNFEIVRRIIFINTVAPDKPLLVIEGRCSIKDEGNQLEVTCKTGKDKFIKNFLGLSPHTTYLAEQVEDANVSVDYYRRSFKPEAIIPDIHKQ